jgi:hypothetical protein
MTEPEAEPEAIRRSCQIWSNKFRLHRLISVSAATEATKSNIPRERMRGIMQLPLNLTFAMLREGQNYSALSWFERVNGSGSNGARARQGWANFLQIHQCPADIR